MSSVTIRATGRFFDTFLRDLSKPERWIEPVGDEQGLVFQAKPDVRQGVPPPGLPHMLFFPPPYHPIEVAMMQRGYGGRYPDYDLENIKTMNGARSHWPTFMELVSRWLYWPKETAAVIYEICTPIPNINGGGPDLTPYRDRLWRALLGRPAAGYSGTNGFGVTPFLFWGLYVKGEVEL